MPCRRNYVIQMDEMTKVIWVEATNGHNLD